MSRIGKKPVPLPQGVTVKLVEGKLQVTGPQGTLTQLMPPRVQINIGAKEIQVEPVDDSRLTRSYWGLARTLTANMVTGVKDGFERKLEIVGIGYRAQLAGQNLQLALGYSHPVIFPLPEGIQAEVDKQVSITIKGADKALVGQTAAKIRELRKPDPYKGKGIKYSDEHIRRKVGKKAGAK